MGVKTFGVNTFGVNTFGVRGEPSTSLTPLLRHCGASCFSLPGRHEFFDSEARHCVKHQPEVASAEHIVTVKLQFCEADFRLHILSIEFVPTLLGRACPRLREKLAGIQPGQTRKTPVAAASRGVGWGLFSQLERFYAVQSAAPGPPRHRHPRRFAGSGHRLRQLSRGPFRPENTFDSSSKRDLDRLQPP